MRPRQLLPLVFSFLVAISLVSPLAQARADSTGSDAPRGAFLSSMTGGNTVGAPIREEKPRADGFRHIDTPEMIKKLKRQNVTMYTYGVWDMPTDWDDLRHEFAPAAEKAGIDIMVYLVPPSECWLDKQPHLDGRCSRPYKLDFVRWSSEIAKLSVQHSNVKSWAIDDFLIGENEKLFTAEYLRRVRAAQEAINPNLKWYVTLYHEEITPKNADFINETLDGVIYPYLGHQNNTIDPTQVEKRLNEVRQVLKPAGLETVLLVYAGRFLDGTIHPNAEYVGEVMRRAKPYLADGRVSGILAYGTPMRLDLAQPSRLYRARSGKGRLSLSLGANTPAATGDHTTASQRVRVDRSAGSQKLTFHHHDQVDYADSGHHIKQLLVDGRVVWQRDAADDAKGEWSRTDVDLTEALAGKSEATISFRLMVGNDVDAPPVDFAVDDVSADGLHVANGNFETPDDWMLDRSRPNLQPYIDIFAANRPTRLFNSVGAAYSDMQNKPFHPVSGGQWPGLRLDPSNRAMYGNGRLGFHIGDGAAIPANTCARASQDVQVRPGMPRYELSFWHADTVADRNDQLSKQVRIDGKTLWDRTVSDPWPWFYLNGSDHQGPINVTEFVRGKNAVRLEFLVCNKSEAPVSAVDIGFDHVESIGLNVRNAGFETPHRWRVYPAAEIDAAIDVHRS